MFKLFLCAALVLPAFAQADIIKCSFTEPFITTTYSMAQQSLTIENMSDNTRQVLRNISFQIKGRGKFELWDANKQLLQKLNLNFHGSDGMSNRVYPYEGKFRDHSGGCTSNFLH